jgi:DNA-directed RNA polymerase specialized sigma24 family protein
LPPLLGAEDLIQEANLVLCKRLDEASVKEDPLSYLVAAGYHAMDCACVLALREPRAGSLDAPRYSDDETPWHEYVPSSVLPASPYANAGDDEYAPLYQALGQLPGEQRTVIEHSYGLGEHAPSNRGEIRDALGWTKSRTTYQRKKTLVALALALKDVYPQYVGQHSLMAHIPERYQQRLDQAYAALQTQGKVCIAHLMRAARVESWMAAAYLHEQGISCLSAHERSRQHLERAYRELRAQGQPVSAKTLAGRAHANIGRARKYLKEQEGYAQAA